MAGNHHKGIPVKEDEDLFAKNKVAATAIDPDSPVYPELADQLNVDLVINEKGRIWVLHDKPFPEILQWIEFDADTNELTFVTMKGKIQNLGMVIPKSFKKYLKGTDFLNTMQVTGGKIVDAGNIPLISRDTGLQ